MDDDRFSCNFLSEHFTDHNENLNAVIVSLKRSRSSYVGHVTKLINKIKKLWKLFNYQMHESSVGFNFRKLKITVNKFISVVEDPNKIEQANKVYCTYV